MSISRCFPASRFVVVGIAVLWAFSTSVDASNDQSYQVLREWIDAAPLLDSITPGQHLTAADREALESVIPRSAWKYYIFDDVDMEIATTANYPAPPDWGKNMSADYQLDEQGVLLNFEGGGFPFEEIRPDDPMAGQKVIWNMLWRPGENDYVMPMVTWMRSENGALDRRLEYTSVNSTYALGDDQCLVPGYEEVKNKRVMEFRSPRDMAGAKDLAIAYVDHYKEDSGWMYVPAQRKPRRTLASERTSELMGMDMIREDINGFGGKVHENNWTYLGKRKVVATINVADNPEFGGPHLWVPNNARWEVRDTHVVLIQPKSANHPYSSRIVFIDAETWWTHWMFAFDRRDDQLLRMNQHFLKYSESYAQVTPAKRGKGNKASTADATDGPAPVERRAAMSWAQRLKRVFNLDIETCKSCGGPVKIIACIEDPVVVEKILRHLEHKDAAATATRSPPSRALPQVSLFG